MRRTLIPLPLQILVLILPFMLPVSLDAAMVQVPYNVNDDGDPKYHNASTLAFPGTHFSEAERDYLLFCLRFYRFNYENYGHDIRRSIRLDHFDLKDNIDPEKLGPIYNDKAVLFLKLGNAESTGEAANITQEHAQNEYLSYSLDDLNDPSNLFDVAEFVWDKFKLGGATYFGPLISWPWDATTFLGTVTYLGLQGTINEWYTGLGRACLNKAWNTADSDGLYRYEDSEDLISFLVSRLGEEIELLKDLDFENTELENAATLNELRNKLIEDPVWPGALGKVSSALECFRVTPVASGWIQSAVTALELGDLTDEDKNTLVLDIPQLWYLERNALKVRCAAHRELVHEHSRVSLSPPVFLSPNPSPLQDDQPISAGEDWEALYTQNLTWQEPDAFVTVGPPNSGHDFATLSDAVQAASAGEAIKVFPGIYPERVTIDVDGLTLFSSEPHEAVLEGVGRYGFLVRADNVTLKDFCVRKKFTGLQVQGARNVQILGNELTANLFAGIGLSSARDCNIRGNRLAENKRYGLYVDRSGKNHIAYNCFAGNGSAPVYAGGDDTYERNRWKDDVPFEPPHIIEAGGSLDRRIYNHPELETFTMGDTTRIQVMIQGLALWPQNEIDQVKVHFYFGDPDQGGVSIGEAPLEVSGNRGVATLSWNCGGFIGKQRIFAKLTTSGDSSLISGAKPQSTLMTVRPPTEAYGSTALFAANVPVRSGESVALTDTITWVSGPLLAGKPCWVQVAEGGHLSLENADSSQGGDTGVPLFLGHSTIIEDIRDARVLEADLTANGPLLRFEEASAIRLGPYSNPDLEVLLSGLNSTPLEALTVTGVVLKRLEVADATCPSNEPGRISNADLASARFDNVKHLRLSHCTFENPGGAGLEIGAGSAHVTLYDCTLRNCQTGLDARQTSHLVMEGGTVEGNTTGITVSDSQTVEAADTTLENNDTGLSVSGVTAAAESPDTTLKIRACNFTGNTTLGCSVSATAGSSFSDNTFLENEVGLSLGMDTQDSVISCNNFIGNAVQAEDQGAQNQWYEEFPDKVAGNYWSTYDGSSPTYVYPSADDPQITDEGPYEAEHHGEEWEYGDATPPGMSGFAVSELEPFSCNFSWTTDEWARAQIVLEDGEQPLQMASEIYTTRHEHEIESLDDQTIYTYTVSSTDLRGNETERTGTFETPDGTPPLVTEIHADDSYHHTLEVFWNTDEPANARVTLYPVTDKRKQLSGTGWFEGEAVPVVVLFDHRRVGVRVRFPSESPPTKASVEWGLEPSPDQKTYAHTVYLEESEQSLPSMIDILKGRDPQLYWEAEFEPSFAPEEAHRIFFRLFAMNGQEEKVPLTPEIPLTLSPSPLEAPLAEKTETQEPSSEWFYGRHYLPFYDLEKGARYEYRLRCWDKAGNVYESPFMDAVLGHDPVPVLEIFAASDTERSQPTEIVDFGTGVVVDASGSYDLDGDISLYRCTIWKDKSLHPYDYTSQESATGILEFPPEAFRHGENDLQLCVQDQTGVEKCLTQSLWVRETLEVDCTGSHGSYDNIEQAVWESKPHDIIRIHPGEYTDCMTISHPLHLEAAGSERPTLFSGSHTYGTEPAVFHLEEGAAGASIEGLQIRSGYHYTDRYFDNLGWASGIVVRADGVALKDLVIQGDPSFDLGLVGVPFEEELRRLRVERDGIVHECRGVWVDGAKYLHLEDCRISEHRVGLDLDAAGFAGESNHQISGNAVYNNMVGLILSESSGDQIAGNAVYCNNLAGLYLNGCVGLQVRGNDILYNKVGLQAADRLPWEDSASRACSSISIERNNFCCNWTDAKESSGGSNWWNQNYWGSDSSAEAELDRDPAVSFHARAGDQWPSVVTSVSGPLPADWPAQAGPLHAEGKRLDRLAGGTGRLVEVDVHKWYEGELAEFPLEVALDETGVPSLFLTPDSDPAISPGLYYLKLYDQHGVRAASHAQVLVGYAPGDLDADCAVGLEDAVLGLRILGGLPWEFPGPPPEDRPLIYRNIDRVGDPLERTIDLHDYRPLIDRNRNGLGFEEVISSLQHVAGLRPLGYTYGPETLSGLWWLARSVNPAEEIFFDFIEPDGSGSLSGQGAVISGTYSVGADGSLEMALVCAGQTETLTTEGELVSPFKAYIHTTPDLAWESYVLTRVHRARCRGDWEGYINIDTQSSSGPISMTVDGQGEITAFSTDAPGVGDLVSGQMFRCGDQARLWMELTDRTLFALLSRQSGDVDLFGEFYEVGGGGQPEGDLLIYPLP